MKAVSSTVGHIDVVVNSPGPWSAVRIEQPYSALARRGWDIRFVDVPFDPKKSIRRGSLVIWQRPLPASETEWFRVISSLRRQGCQILVEWDDHLDLFPAHVLQKSVGAQHIQLRCCHAIQTSSTRLAKYLRNFNPHVFVVENGVDRIQDYKEKHLNEKIKIFIGNFNRERELSVISHDLSNWLHELDRLNIVAIGSRGLEELEHHVNVKILPPQKYFRYREILRQCHIALIPLERGEPQACKTPIKWLEAAAESVAVVAGPELYDSWFDNSTYGMFASSLNEIVPSARWLVNNPKDFHQMTRRAHDRISDFSLNKITFWRETLYSHLFRLRPPLEKSLNLRFPLSD